MKFILTAAIIATAFTQFTDNGMEPAQPFEAQPIKIIQPIRHEPRKEIKKENGPLAVDQKNQRQEIVTEKQQKGGLRVDNENVEQKYEQKKQAIPIFGEKQFNPSEIKPHRPQPHQQRNDFVPHPPREGRQGHRKPREGRGPREERRPRSQGRPHPPMSQNFQKQGAPGDHSNWQGPENWDKPRRHNGPSDEMRIHQQNRQQTIGGSSPFAPGWEEQKRWGKNQHKKNKKLCIAFFITAVIFTIFGLCLGKCAMKCKKNRKERIRHILMRSRTSAQIYQEIQETERKGNELKSQYRNKKAQEERLAHEFRRQEEVNFQYETQMRNVHYPQRHPQVFYAQQPYQIPRATIPVGRPLNETNNSSFASEYPQL